jgi:hypothetical protein
MVHETMAIRENGLRRATRSWRVCKATRRFEECGTARGGAWRSTTSS